MDMYKRSIEEPSEFWSEIASSEFYWKKEWDHNQAFNENLDITKGNINIEVTYISILYTILFIFSFIF